MKKTLSIICAAAALVAGLWSCQPKDNAAGDNVDLRYRVADSYDLAATNAQSFTILVSSTEPWTVTSEHPDWCIIDIEEGAASPADEVRVGKAPATTIRVQYYDNTQLDDRTDHIIIASDRWVGKRVTVNQKGIAFLTVPEEDLDQDVIKAGGDLTIHINANQDWSSKVTDGDWMSITEGATGNGEGTVTLSAEENPSELRYAEVTIYDRHDVARALVKFTQDGVQLVPLSDELRAGFDQLSVELGILSNTKWKVEKTSDTDTWFTIDTPTGEGNGTIRLTLTKNGEEGLRKAQILVKNIVSSEDEAAVEKSITVKQAYEILPVRHIVDNDELSLWKSDQANAPVYTKDQGTYFLAYCRLNRSMPFGSYTFRWKDISAGARVRHWFCFSDGVELKADIRPASAKISFDFNASSTGNKPSVSSYTDVDFTAPIEFTYKFDPSGTEFCHVTYLVNGVEAGSFDTTADVLNTCTWGANVNMYFGVQDEADTGNSAICEWYEYIAPINWD